MKIVSNMAAAIACCGLLLPQSVLADVNQPQPKYAKPPVNDLVLGERGTLHGQIVDPQNKPIASTAVIVMASGKKIRETTTDDNGRFAIEGLRSGLYAVGSKGGFGVYRAWTPVTAPPGAQSAALIVEDAQVVRGQGRFWYWVTNPWLVSLGIAAAIAVPIVLNNNDKKKSS